MRTACKEAAQYGDSLIPMERNPTVVTVILNPVANKRAAKKDFEAYCEPLLHLAGLQVDIVQTASEGNAKEIVETLKGTEAIIVAGGDGTLSETVTGIFIYKMLINFYESTANQENFVSTTSSIRTIPNSLLIL